MMGSSGRHGACGVMMTETQQNAELLLRERLMDLLKREVSATEAHSRTINQQNYHQASTGQHDGASCSRRMWPTQPVHEDMDEMKSTAFKQFFRQDAIQKLEGIAMYQAKDASLHHRSIFQGPPGEHHNRKPQGYPLRQEAIKDCNFQGLPRADLPRGHQAQENQHQLQQQQRGYSPPWPEALCPQDQPRHQTDYPGINPVEISLTNLLASGASSSSGDGYQLPQSCEPTAPATGANTDFPSEGSELHSAGKCKPCLFLHTSTGCLKGLSCKCCHLTHTGKAVKAIRPRPGLRKLIKRMNEDAPKVASHELSPTTTTTSNGSNDQSGWTQSISRGAASSEARSSNEELGRARLANEVTDDSTDFSSGISGYVNDEDENVVTSWHFWV